MSERSGPEVIVVGAGIIGAVAAWQLQSKGARVTVVDAGGANATRASFGWVNASFYIDDHHHHLRAEGMAAYRRMTEQLPVPVNTCGSLCWDGSAEELEARAAVLRGFGYPVEMLDSDALRALEPAVAVRPECVLRFPTEAAVEQDQLVSILLAAATARGARIVSGVRVEGLTTQTDRVTGVRLSTGTLAADQVLLAAGTGTPGVMAGLGLSLPMLDRPALVLRTRPVRPCLAHILATDIGDIRQLPDGALMMPASVNHQSDDADTIASSPESVADAALARLRGLFPSLDLAWAQVTLAQRPVPGDGRPVVGAVAPGLSVAVLHSGITLAAIIGELIATEMLGGVTDSSGHWLEPYRPQRFQS